MTPPAEQPVESAAEYMAARSASPLSPRSPQVRARKLLVITGEPRLATSGPAPRAGGSTPQLRDAVTAAVNAAKRVRRTAPIN
jgi:hypothetical protein